MTDATTTATDDRSLGDKKLKLAGYSYMLGDAAMVAAEMARGNKFADAAKAGSIWFAGGLAAARYGNPSADKQLELLAHKLERHLTASGAAIPDNAREQNALLKQQNFWGRVENFLYEHPSETLNGAYGVGAGFLIHKGISQLKQGYKPLPGMGGKVANFLWMGGLIMAGAIGGLVIKEYPQAREKAQGKGTVAKVKAYFHEKANRLPGLLYGMNNIPLAAQVMQDFRDHGNKVGLKPHLFSATTLATYVFSNLMLQFSSRDQINEQGLNPSQVAQLEDAAARVIAAQPPALQQELILNISHYLADQKNVGPEAPQIAQSLANRLTEITGERAQEAVNKVSWAEREKMRSIKNQSLNF